MTEQLLERIKISNPNIYTNIQSLKVTYRNPSIDRVVILAEIRGYLMGLMQTGFITQSEKQRLFCYITI